MGLFDKLKKSLSKTRDSIGGAVDNVIRAFTGIDDDLFDELEEALILADVGVNTSTEVVEKLRSAAKEKKIADKDALRAELREILMETMKKCGDTAISNTSPTVILMIGVNGVGKTTTVGKLANYFTKQNKSVLIAAADTFRAAAVEQLATWAERADVGIIKQQEGSDPAAVVFDAANAARARGTDVLICDTAGRLHNKKNLMDELAKIKKIVERELPNAAKEVLLVLDATTGQNAVIQAQEFAKATDITGIVLTKLDGTAKGGIVIAIANEHNIPVKLVGVGEGIDDLCEFDAETFVDGILG
ncbi:MAG: signal recognition particle-docking protein FtsY [Oscillospiraceae bacterium]|nr:signal recognition particle-docking protein FtsY [Oscillospiraceae bacterium]